jgi:hypothetical protein
VAVMGLAVAGIVGLVGPLIAAWSASRRLAKQQEHERMLSDLDHLRDLLDAAIAEGEGIHSNLIDASVALNRDNFEEAWEHLRPAIDRLSELHARCRRVALRRGPKDELVKRLNSFRDALGDFCKYLTNNAAPSGGYEDSEGDRKMHAVVNAQNRLIEFAVPLIGVVSPNE